MKKLFLNVFLACLFLVIIQACKDNDNVEPNTTITANDFTVSIAENPINGDVIGTVSASASDGADLTYSLSNENVSNALAIDANTGALTVADASAFDFETNPSITANYTASNGTEEATASITITVNDVSEPTAFITTWETTTVNESITIHTRSGEYTYNYSVDWGDGNTTTETGDATHQYADAGTYQVSITGTFPAIHFGGSTFANSQKIKSIDQWGIHEWRTTEEAFLGCINMTYEASDIPNLSQVTNMSSMFRDARAFNGVIGNWNISNVTNMSKMFQNALSFNQDIGSWDVGNVTDMEGMFIAARVFNQDIGNWEVDNVTNMRNTFLDAQAFNQDISNWNVSNVTNMRGMFYLATSFNGNIGSWEVDNVTNMDWMFREASSFNGNIGNWGVRVSNVINMNNMFFDATSFNQDISSWDVSSVTDMTSMFQGASSFNQNISGWNTINVGLCNLFAVDSPIFGTSNIPTAGPCL